MHQHEIGPSEMAKRLGVNHASVIRYRDGSRRPDPDVMQRIFEETGGQVAPNDFYDFIEPQEPAA